MRGGLARQSEGYRRGVVPDTRMVTLCAVLASRLDETYSDEVRSSLLPLTVAKIAANSAFRFAAPFVATIASGLHVSLASVGGAIALGEFVGLSAPLVTRAARPFQRRSAMTIGLLGMALGASISAVSRSIVVFGVGLVILAVSKIVFDLGVIAWITDRVAYAKVGRAIGLTETAWAIGLCVGVVLMGLLTGVTSWRWGYVLAVLAIVVMAAVIHSRLPSEFGRVVAAPVAHRDRARLGNGWWVIAGTVTLTAASQSVFVTFGKWLQDDFHFSDTQLTAVIFAFGAVELVATSSTIRFVDAWGKQRSVLYGSAVMVPLGAALALLHHHLFVGVALLALFIGAFEFTVLSTISLSNSLVPSNPSSGLAMMVSGATLGRAVMASVATAAYSAHGMWLPAAIGSSCAAVTWLCHQRHRALSAHAH
ncbi:MAG: transporter [Ilumatobacteraceae bacterium]|nr:transporter [Ilumatobacteraceae bacterium]